MCKYCRIFRQLISLRKKSRVERSVVLANSSSLDTRRKSVFDALTAAGFGVEGGHDISIHDKSFT